MYRLNKTSQIVSVSPDIILKEYEHLLNKEGLTGGYLPYEGYEISLEDCIYDRKPNLLGLKYGGFDEICSAGIAYTPKGRTYKMNQAPRAATGSDLCKVVVGGEKVLGTFKEVTMRVFPISEDEIWTKVDIQNNDEVKFIFRNLWGQFIRPLFAAIGDDGLFYLKFSGMKKMLKAEKKAISKLFKDQFQFDWIDSRFEVQDLDQKFIQKKYHQDFIEKMSPLVGRSNQVETPQVELDLLSYIKKKN